MGERNGESQKVGGRSEAYSSSKDASLVSGVPDRVGLDRNRVVKSHHWPQSHCESVDFPAVVEVGEVESSGEVIYLDEVVAEAAESIKSPQKRFVVEEVLINQQKFTKLANCFKVDNNQKGTNTNRLVVLKCISKRQVGAGKGNGKNRRRSK